MALKLSTRAEILSQKIEKGQQIILEIEGIDLVFGAVDVAKLLKFGDGFLFGDPGLYFGGVVTDENSRPYISLGGSTSRSITQQLNQDKGGTGSVSSVVIELLDKGGELTRIFSPNQVVADVLSKRANVYLAFQGGAHPEDSIQIFSGIIDNLEFGAGKAIINIAHPEQLKRQTLFPQVATKLNGSINNSVSTVVLDSTEDLVAPPADTTLISCIRIDNEIIKIGSISNATTLSGCTRGYLGTTAASQADNAEVSSFYVLEGSAIDLALKLMMSGTNGPFVESVAIANFEEIPDGSYVDNAVYFAENVVTKYGVTVGDLVTITGSTIGANNVTSKEIIDAVELEDGSSYIVLDAVTLVDETETAAVAAFRSQYDTLGHGAGMSPMEVDVAEHHRINNVFGANFHTYTFYLVDDIKLKEFLENEIYFPSGMYQIPRKGRSSVGFTAPPVASLDTKVIGFQEVMGPDKIKIGRTINKNFYNSVIFKFDESVLEEGKFNAVVITADEDSANRIKVGNRPLTIKAKGIRTANGGVALAQLQARRFLERYKYAAESIQIDVMYGAGFNVEVGDIVAFGDSDLKISDITKGNREFDARLMEVTNKAMDIVTGKIKLTLVDSAFDINARFTSISPSSIVTTGATTTYIPLLQSYGWTSIEKKKWTDYIGESVRVRSADFSVSGESVIQGFDPVNQNTMIVSPALGFTPSSGYVVEPPAYDTASTLWKKLHGFVVKQDAVVSGTSSTVFEVANGSYYIVGYSVRVHDDSFTNDSGDVKIVDVTGTTITVEDMGFTPNSTYVVDLLAFSDQGKPYTLI